MRIDFAKFVTSAVEPGQYPSGDRPEVAFGGRSNVGKSSLMNTLMERRNLVETSKTPGRTRTINFFDVNGELYLVDLPGYGYADVPDDEQEGWAPMIESYLAYRRNLSAIVCIMDIRRGIEEDDRQLIEAAPHFDLQPILVFTKVDKVGKQQRQQRRREIAEGIGFEPDDLLLFSAEDETGKDALWSRITSLTGILD